MDTMADSADELARMLLAQVPAPAATEPHLRAVLREGAAHPGRMLRGRLVLAAAAAHALPRAPALAAACALEYFHLASLLLDDLPCMDDATTRRGRLCLHHRHGEASVILAALALINRAYALVGEALHASPAPVRRDVQALLDDCLGPAGVVGGQARDLRFAESDRSAREVGRIALTKTGALFRLAVGLPALLAGADAPARRRLHRLCVCWGLAYQVADDLNDVLGDGAATGKTAGRDRALRRPNLALALGVPVARRRLARLVDHAARAAGDLQRADPRWTYLAEFHRRCFVAPDSPSARQLATLAA